MIEMKRQVEDNVFATFFQGTSIIGRLFMTAHPTIHFEVFAYKQYGPVTIDSKRVNTEEEASKFIEEFINTVISYTHIKLPRADQKTNSIDEALCGDRTGVYHTLRVDEKSTSDLPSSLFDAFPLCPVCGSKLNESSSTMPTWNHERVGLD
jgi:hypothetical protein